MLNSIAPMQEQNPQIYGVDEAKLPAMKDWEVGETYRVEMTIKQTGKNIREDYTDEKAAKPKKRMVGDFEVMSIKPIGSQSQMEKMRKRYGKS